MTEPNTLKPAFEPGLKFYKESQLPEDKKFMLNALSVADNGDGTTLIVGPEMYDNAVSWHELGKRIAQMSEEIYDTLRMGKKEDWDRLDQCAYLKRAWLKANPDKENQRYWEADGETRTKIYEDVHDNAMVRYPGMKDEGISQRVSVSKDHLAFGRWFCDVKNFDLLDL